MTPEVRKQIEEKADDYTRRQGTVDRPDIIKHDFTQGAEFGYSLANKEIEKYKEFITEVSVSDPDGNPLRLINKARKILNNL